MANRILVVDDEKAIVKGLRFSLMTEGWQVDCAYDGGQAVELARQTEYDAVLLDLMLPVLDGMQVCQQIREFSDMPIIMLTAKSDDMDKIMGLEFGADDYVTKPFNILELKARIKAIVRRNNRSGNHHNWRAEEEDNQRLKVQDLEMDLQSRRVFLQGKEVNLTTKEFDLLELLLSNPGKVYSREELMDKVWGFEYSGDVRTVDVHVRRLREKVEPNPSDPRYVYTKWGAGYYYKGK